MKLTKKILSILILSFFVLLCHGDNSITFNENEDNLIPFQIISYEDNTIVFHLVKKLNNTCLFEPRSVLTFRILYSIGTSDLINIYNHDIPPNNFCDDTFYVLNTIPGYILVIYVRFTDVFGMMIDWGGNIRSNTLLGNIRILDFINLAGVYDEDVNQYEYRFFENLPGGKLMIKKFVTMSDKGELIKIQENLIQTPENYSSLRIFPTINSFLFIFIYNPTVNITTLNDISLEPGWKFYGSILQKDTNQLSDPFLIYQTATLPIELDIMSCLQSYDGSGFNCFIVFSTNPVGVRILIEVTFLSNGRITETKKETGFDINNINSIRVLGIESGGFVIATVKPDITGCSIIGYFLDRQSSNIGNNTTSEVHMDFPCIIIIAKNNTALLAPEKKTKYWTLLAIDIPSLLDDKGYDNPIIDWTTPAINDTIALGTTQIQITYKIPIQCSSQNISIYQKLDNMKDILRETYSGKSINCQVLSDNTTLSLTLLPCTFNQPNSVYYVKIDADFVRHNKTLEPLLGISSSKWMFKTESRQYIIDDRPTSGFLRLTEQGTLYFENLSSNEKSTFLKNLTSQLAEIIPVQSNRIENDNKYQIDTKAPLRQVLINIRILKSDRISEFDVPSIINNLDTLIRNKETTSISANNLTSMLDDTYGFQKYSSFRDIITVPVIVMVIILFILIICYATARRQYKEGKNEFVIIIAFVLYDFVVDLLFLFDLKNKQLTLLFWLSLICTIPPIIFNLIAAIYIISRENSENPKFYNYFIKNTMAVSACSVLAGTDIEAIRILSSKFAGLDVFSAKFSETAENYIFWCAIIGFLFEDIPQFGIQIAYHVSRIEYTLIPALTLISNIFMLLINVVGRLHSVIIKCRNIPLPANDNNDYSDDKSETNTVTI